MSVVATINKTDFLSEMEENKKEVRNMVMESYHDMKKEKGRDYKDFFNELEGRYKDANV